MNKKNEYQDEGLKGNERIEDAIFALQKEATLTVPEIAGIIINPWNRTIMLDKHLIRIIMPD